MTRSANGGTGGGTMTRGSRSHRQLKLRILAALGLPLLGAACWEEQRDQEIYQLAASPEGICPSKETVPLGAADGDRCHPGIVISVDEGPLPKTVTSADGQDGVVCEYLVTRERSFSVSNSLCLGSGRPLVVLDHPRIATLIHERWG
jgi:hypothetical protein